MVPRLQRLLESIIVFVWISIFCENVDAADKPSLVIGRSKYGSIGSAYGLGPEPMAPMSGMPEMSITQKQDNFDPSNPNTFPNMYYVNNAFYRPGGPMFLMFRGESAASISFMVAGAWIKYAEQYGAKLYQLEHRYYGKSVPTPDLSTENLRFLSVEQAMADAANFITKMNEQNRNPPDTKWILFGGSYAGAMAVWFRVRYPGLTHGSISSSGPINPVVNFAEYYSAISGAIGDHSPRCADAINAAFLQLWPLMNDPRGQLEVSDDFRLCSNLNSSSIQDKINLQFALSSSFASIVQYNNDNIGANMMNIRTICNVMGNSSFGSPVDQLASYVSLYLTNNGENCEGYRYQGTVASLSQYTLTSASVVSGDRQWFYQTCSELGYFQTSDDPYEVFGQGFSSKFFWQECSDVFGSNFRPLKKITLNYGGYSPPTDNVLCLQGSLDPWRKLGYTRNTTKGVMAFYIEGTAHVADMYEPAPTDPPSLTAARLVTSAYIGRLLDERPTYYRSPVFIVPSDSSAISDSSDNPGVKAPHYNLNQTVQSFHSQNSTFIDPNFVGASVEAGVSKVMRFSKTPQLPTLKGEPGMRGGPRRSNKHHKGRKNDKGHKKDKRKGKKHHKKPVSSSANSSSSGKKKNKKGKKKHHPKKHYHGKKHFEPSRTGTRSFSKPSTKNAKGSESVPTASPLNSLHNSNPKEPSFMASMKPFKSIALKNLNKSPVMANSTSAAPMPSGTAPQQSESSANGNKGNKPVNGNNPAANGSSPAKGAVANAQNSQSPPPPPPRAHRRPAARHRPHGRSGTHRHPHHGTSTSSSSQSKHKILHRIGHKRGAPRRPMRLRHPPRFPGDSRSSSSSPSSSNSGSGKSSSPGSSSPSAKSGTKATSSGSSSSST